jgi:NAD(P)H-flavin reductase
MVPKKLIGKVEFKEKLAGNNYLIRLLFDEKLDFIPGQYASIKVSEAGHRRSYSIANLPGEKTVELLVDITPMGMGSRYMMDLQVGDPVEMLCFLGRFVVEEPLLAGPDKLLFVATGTGIAPFKPMIKDLLERKQFKGEIRLVWGMRYERDLYWVQEFEEMDRRFSNFQFDLTLSKPTPEWKGKNGRVEVVIDKLLWEWSEVVVYLCGSTGMVEEMKEKLKTYGVVIDKIFYEKFF